jgi:hypothetical protein
MYSKDLISHLAPFNMNVATRVGSYLSFWAKRIDWKLLLFLVLFLNVKLVVKLLAIGLIYLLQPRAAFGFRLKGSRLPLFYPVVIGIAAVDFLLYRGFSSANTTLLFLYGITFWALGLLAVHQVKHLVEKNTPQVIYHTLIVFFLLNTAVSLAELGRIILETGALNPYRYQGNYQKYFIGTGDYIKGLSFDTSTTNAALNAFGVLFFLFRRNAPMLFVCLGTLLLTSSNLVNALLAGCLLGVFCFRSDRVQKSLIVAACIAGVVFAARVTPQNHQYVGQRFDKLLGPSTPVLSPAKKTPVTEQPDALLTAEERREKTARLYLDSLSVVVRERRHRLFPQPDKVLVQASASEKPLTLPQDDIHSAPFQSRNDTNALRRELLHFIARHHPDLDFGPRPLPGKLIAFGQTAAFLSHHPGCLLTGGGAGNFSSKLAFKATGFAAGGGYPEAYRYIHPDFNNNHLRVYLYYFSKQPALHSVANSPNATYNQLAGEYGLMGLGAFVLFYLGYFAKGLRRLTYGIPILLLLTGLLAMDYWFEQLSIIVLFETLLFLDQKETAVP